MALSLFKNFLSLAGAEAFGKLVTFAAFAYLARLFGAAGFGHIEWAGAALMCASLIVDQGFNSYGAREIAKNKERTAELVAEIVTARFFFAAAAYLLVALVAFQFAGNAALRRLLLVYGLSLWILPLLLQWVFQGHDRMQLSAAAQVIRQLVFFLVIIVFVSGPHDLLMVGAAEVAAVSCAAVFTLGMYRRNFPTSQKHRPALSARLFREGVPIGLSQAFWTVKMFGATFIIGFAATAEDTGFFAGAMRIYIALHTFVWLYYVNLLPSLSRKWEEDRTVFAQLIARSLRIVIPVGSIGALVWVAAAPSAMTVAYGQDFAGGAAALQWLAGAFLAAAVSGHYRFGLIAAGLQNLEMWSSALGAAAVILLLPAGYFYGGTGGAAAALCVSEIFILLVVWLMAKRKLFAAPPLRIENKELNDLSEATR